MPEKYAYRVRILFFDSRKKYACWNTHVEIRMFGKRQYTVKQTSKSKNFIRICVFFYTHIGIFYAYP